MTYDLKGGEPAQEHKKVISGRLYWYLREMAWVEGKPKMVFERYVGSAAEIAALLEAREAAILPEQTRHLAFGDLAAAWGVLTRLGVIETIDEVVGARRSDAGVSVGTYLTLAALNPGQSRSNRTPDLCQSPSKLCVGEQHARLAAALCGFVDLGLPMTARARWTASAAPPRGTAVISCR